MRMKRFPQLLVGAAAAGALTFLPGAASQAMAAPPASAAVTAPTAHTLAPQSRADYKHGWNDGREDARNCDGFSPSSKNSDYRKGYAAAYSYYYDGSEC